MPSPYTTASKAQLCIPRSIHYSVKNWQTEFLSPFSLEAIENFEHLFSTSVLYFSKKQSQLTNIVCVVRKNFHSLYRSLSFSINSIFQFFRSLKDKKVTVMLKLISITNFPSFSYSRKGKNTICVKSLPTGRGFHPSGLQCKTGNWSVYYCFFLLQFHTALKPCL
jgi:hypothetical protein